MKIIPIGAVLMLLASGVLAESPGKTQEEGMLVIKDPSFTKLVPEDAKVEKVAEGLVFTEGPVWHPGGYLIFSDCHANTMYRWQPEEKVAVYRKPSGPSNGLTIDSEGRLLLCDFGSRVVSRIEKDGTVKVLASHYKGKRFNAPNDLVVKSDGSIYFTDPGYGVKEEEQELGFRGVFRISPKGEVTLLVDDFDRPNGLAFSPDEKILYIADSSSRMHIRAFDVTPEGTLTNGRVFAQLRSKDPGPPDGFKVDMKGHIFTSGPGGIWVYAPSGKLLGIIKTPEIPANCAWGDADGKTLYITARTGLYRVRTATTGVRPWMQKNKCG